MIPTRRSPLINTLCVSGSCRARDRGRHVGHVLRRHALDAGHFVDQERPTGMLVLGDQQHRFGCLDRGRLGLRRRVEPQQIAQRDAKVQLASDVHQADQFTLPTVGNPVRCRGGCDLDR